MILQRLYEYYQRKSENKDSLIAPPGLEWKEIPYLIIINSDGEFIRFESTIEGEGKNKRAKKFLIPKYKIGPGVNSWKTTNSFWGHYGYVLGYSKVNNPELEDKFEQKKNEERALKQNGTFRKEVDNYLELYPENKGFRAVSLFYDISENMNKFRDDELWAEIIKKDGTNLAFKVQSDESIVADQPQIFKEDFSKDLSQEKPIQSVCLITGRKSLIKRVHTNLTLSGSSGSKIVSFQTKSGYDSYYKEKGANAPVSLEAESAYSTALTEMLANGSKNKFRLGDSIILFWAQKKDDLEEELPLFFTCPDKDNPDRNIQAIENLYKAPFKGHITTEGDNGFYILGLEPNKTRITIRIWKEGTVEEISGNIRQHFQDLQIVQDYNKDYFYPLHSVLQELVRNKKKDNPPPNLMGAVFLSVINNTPYPATLLNLCINRIRADRTINRKRAAILKAYLNRKNRITNYKQEKEITMALDLTNTNQAYLCGRLFAVLEKIQERANPELNATIKDRYYGSASTTPIAVFSRLIDLAMKHLSKIGKGSSTYYDKIVCEIISGISPDGFPSHLSMEDQSRFAIGYYHQRQALFSSSKEQSEAKKETDNE